jgi:hypothetical protein
LGTEEKTSPSSDWIIKELICGSHRFKKDMEDENGVSIEEAQQFAKDQDERVAKAREGMGLPPKVEAEIETPVEETETEEVETPEEEETETEEEPAESDDTEEEEEPQTRDKSVFRQLNEIRSQKRQAEAEKAAALEELNKIREENASLKANLPPPQPFLDYAKANGINDPKQIQSLYDTFRGQLELDLGSKINALSEKVASYETKEVERQEANAFHESMVKLDGEWKEVAPFVEAEYKPTATQMEEAKSLMAELAHNEQYHDKELDYILYKEAPQFEQIFGARKRRTMFSSHGRVQSTGEVRRNESEHDRIMRLKKEQTDKMNTNDGGFDSVQEGSMRVN